MSVEKEPDERTGLRVVTVHYTESQKESMADCIDYIDAMVRDVSVGDVLKRCKVWLALLTNAFHPKPSASVRARQAFLGYNTLGLCHTEVFVGCYLVCSDFIRLDWFVRLINSSTPRRLP